MINLEFVNKCPSVLTKSLLKQRLKFYSDTRKYTHPGFFVAIPGAKVNPLDIIDSLLNLKCPLVVYQKDSTNEEKVKSLKAKYPSTEFVPVTDSVIFLQELSHLHIEDWKKADSSHKVFAISGSNGKTTHKEMLSFILKEVFPGKVVSTEKNNNNHLGVPLTLLEVNEFTKIVVLELGSNHPGEIKVLCDIARPNSGLTTTIGATHLEFFGDEEAVFKEEGFLYHAVKEVTSGEGFYLINKDDKFLKSFSPTKGSITFGEAPDAMAKISYLEHGAEITFKNEKYTATNLAITGRHNKLNLVTSLFIASNIFPDQRNKFEEACKHFQPTKNRSEWITFEGRSIFLDAYNANPSSMKAALEGFKESVLEKGHSLHDACIVLGDMNELGDSTPRYHEEIGSFVKNLGFTNVFYVGQYSNHYLKGHPNGHSKTSSAAFKKEYQEECLKKYSIHFIKGSRSLQLESLFVIT